MARAHYEGTVNDETADNTQFSNVTPSSFIERAHSFVERPSCRFSLVALLIIITIEICVFNIGSWISPSSDESMSCNLSNSCTYSLNNARLISSAADSNTKSDTTAVEISHLDASLVIPVKPGTHISTLEFTTSDATPSSYFSPITVGTKQVTLTAHRDSFVFLPSQVSDKIARSGKVIINFPQAPLDTRSATPSTTIIPLQSVTLNAHKPFHFNIFRVIAIFLLCAFVWFLRPGSRIYSIELNTHSRKQKRYFGLFVILPFTLLAVASMVATGIFVGEDTWFEQGNYIYSYHHYILASQSILEGHPWVNLPIDDAFASLSNPYDPQARNILLSQGSQIYWDYAFFNNHWYSYFAILPSLLIYIPFHALTGQWPSIFTVIAPLLAISIIMTLATVIRFIKRYFPRASIGHTILVLISVFVGMNFIQLLMVTNLYAVAFTSALCINSIGLFIWMKVSSSAPRFKDYARMAIGSLLIALSSSCRPTFIFMAILVAPIFFETVWKKPLSTVVKATAACIIPAILGILPSLWYNWWRFGSIFDFGSRYQITVTDVMHLHASPIASLQGSLYYLFYPLEFSSNPPYIESPSIVTSTWIHRETFIAGLFIIAPVIFIALISALIPRVRHHLLHRFMWVYTVFGVLVGTFLCVFITRSGGIAWRYVADFSWAFTFAALAPLLFIMTYAQRGLSRKMRLWINWTIVLATTYEIVILIATIFIPNRFASFIQYAPQLYAFISDAMTIIP
ncbi:hypothetical protein EJ419_08155 [Alloscardovia theropitheci]|uniref:Glycosyltransferase n=1 Tax=Alloscardovia theropitheci TaxID=2496842 RepID=A0A4R0QN44_9BIFI|nr:hypothetical protein [Alloscardovia theropitheci]TCD53602.1 hypothetical protein EJ419_08155 [Alloscardovia theropitheci]